MKNYENYSIQRVAKGNDALEGEESTNASIGLVLTPGNNWIITVDKWQIEQESVVGFLVKESYAFRYID